eukprot:145975-Amphidinium_carterae.1
MRWAGKVFRLKSVAQFGEVTQKFENAGISYLTHEKNVIKESTIVPNPFVARRLGAYPEGIWIQPSRIVVRFPVGCQKGPYWPLDLSGSWCAECRPSVAEGDQDS